MENLKSITYKKEIGNNKNADGEDNATNKQLVKHISNENCDVGQRINELEKQLEYKNKQLQDVLIELDLVKQYVEEKNYIKNKIDLTQNELKTIYSLDNLALTEKEKLEPKKKTRNKEDLSRALNLCSEQCDRLSQLNKILEDKNKRLNLDLEINQGVIMKKAMENKKYKETIAILREKLSQYEENSSLRMEKIESDKKNFESFKKEFILSTSEETKKLTIYLNKRNKEMNKVKWLARNILNERTETECFFIEILNEIRRMKRSEDKTNTANRHPEITPYTQLTWVEKEKIIEQLLSKIYTSNHKTHKNETTKQQLQVLEGEKMKALEFREKDDQEAKIEESILSIMNEPAWLNGN